MILSILISSINMLIKQRANNFSFDLSFSVIPEKREVYPLKTSFPLNDIISLSKLNNFFIFSLIET